MYYNVNDQILVDVLPKVLIKEDGSLFIDFDESTIEVAADYGFYYVNEDNVNDKPINAISEMVHKRQIVLKKPYAKIIRNWLINPIEEN
jgi:hypothetical protein